jgi:hypothetical protein
LPILLAKELTIRTERELFLFCGDFKVAASGLFWRMTARLSGIVEFAPRISIRPKEFTTRPEAPPAGSIPPPRYRKYHRRTRFGRNAERSVVRLQIE